MAYLDIGRISGTIDGENVEDLRMSPPPQDRISSFQLFPSMFWLSSY